MKILFFGEKKVKIFWNYTQNNRKLLILKINKTRVMTQETIESINL